MMTIALVLVSLFSVFFAMIQVYYRNRWVDQLFSISWYVLYAIPTFWFATLMVVFFTTPEYGSWTDIFPSIGIKPSFGKVTFMSELIQNIGQIILPILCLTLMSLPYITIQLRKDLILALGSPFVLTARAKGVNEARVISRHALPNALVPYITILTGAIPQVFTGSVLIEVIFNIPGIGKLMLNSMELGDWPVVFTIVIVISVVTIIGYFIGDWLLIKLFPKTTEHFQSSSAVVV